MKALLIAESEDILNSFNDFFNTNGYDTICYNWLLKALDNMEEIAPHVVLINSIDYPRHWKTLVQYIRSNDVIPVSIIILVTAENFDEDEQAKAKILDVHCVCTDIDTPEIREQLLALLELQQTPSLHSNIQSEKPILVEHNQWDQTKSSNYEPIIKHEVLHSEEQSDMVIDSAVEKDPTGTYFTFNHPHTKIWINGTVEHYNHPILVFKPSNTAHLDTIRFGKKIEACTLTVANVDSLINVQVQGTEDGAIEFCIIK